VVTFPRSPSFFFLSTLRIHFLSVLEHSEADDWSGRDPRWGRGQETPGEDPFHLKSYVAALIDGLQGGYDPPIKKVVATCKHFVAYDLEVWEDTDRYTFDAIVSTQDLAEYYFQPFQTCARDAGVG